MTLTNTKTVLKIGALACCLIGFCQAVLVFHYYRNNRPADFRDFLGLIVCAAYFLLAFAPAVMFIQFRTDSELLLRLKTIRAVEILVFVFLLASLIV